MLARRASSSSSGAYYNLSVRLRPDGKEVGGFGSLNVYVDAQDEYDCPGRYVNDNFDPRCINAHWRKDALTQTATLIASRAIRSGEEIYANYGESYWIGWENELVE